MTEDPWSDKPAEPEDHADDADEDAGVDSQDSADTADADADADESIVPEDVEG